MSETEYTNKKKGKKFDFGWSKVAKENIKFMPR